MFAAAMHPESNTTHSGIGQSFFRPTLSYIFEGAKLTKKRKRKSLKVNKVLPAIEEGEETASTQRPTKPTAMPGESAAVHPDPSLKGSAAVHPEPSLKDLSQPQPDVSISFDVQNSSRISAPQRVTLIKPPSRRRKRKMSAPAPNDVGENYAVTSDDAGKHSEDSTSEVIGSYKSSKGPQSRQHNTPNPKEVRLSNVFCGVHSFFQM